MSQQISDNAKAFNTMMAAFRAAHRGDFAEAISLQDSILRMDVEPRKKVSAHIFKSYYLIAMGRHEDAARETELALQIDRCEETGEFEDDGNRAMVLGNLDCEWLDQLKAFGRADEWMDGIEYAEKKLQLFSHVSGTYMPLTRFWIARKLALMGQKGRAAVQLAAGMTAEVVGNDHYKDLVRSRASSVMEALEDE